MAAFKSNHDEYQHLFKMYRDSLEIIKSLNNTIDDLRKVIADQNEEIRKLSESIRKDSHNSSKPPSSDGLKKKPSPKSLREKTGKKQGGQTSHPGSNLKKMEPTRIEPLMPAKCAGCPHYTACQERFCNEQSPNRQVVDVKVTPDVTEYRQAVITDCPMHHDFRCGEFPAGVTGNIQYGDTLTALTAAFYTVGAVSIDRIHEILGSVFGIPLSTGTIYSMVSRCADNLTGTYNEIKTQMMVAALSHFDETGTRVEGKTWWVHVACNSLYTYLYIHKKRGKKAMEAEGVLPAFRGIAVHDCWSSYWYYNDAEHAVCNEHLLRELVGVSENHENQTWSKAFYDLLLKMNSTKDKLQRKGCMEASYYYRHKYSEEYDSLLEKAYKQNPEPEQVPGKKGRKKRGKVLALIDRLKTYKASVCLFFENFDVPFTNNMAEQAIRIIKVKTKVSGCFRKEDGAKDYLKIMSYVGTVKKQGYNVFDAILNAVKGTPYNVIPVVAAE